MVDNTLQQKVDKSNEGISIDGNTIQPKVVEPQLVPKWAQVGAELACGKLPTHISSQESPRWRTLSETWIDDGKRPKYWIRESENMMNGSIFQLEQESFTCVTCPEPVATGHYVCQCCSNYGLAVSTIRCSPCNTRYMRWKRVRKAFKWLAKICEDKKCRPKFLTITKTLRTSPTPFTEEMIEADRQKMMREFRMTRKSKAWPNRYAGIWVYEAKVRAPGDIVQARWKDENGNREVLRTATEFELHGHIHCALATRYLQRDPLLERHEGIHVKVSKVNHMKKYLMGYMLVDTVGRYNRIGGEKTWE